MNILETVSSALSGILGNKMRAILTMFGIIVGISSVITITSIGEGYRQSINKQFEEMGLDNMTLTTYSENETIEYLDNLTNDDVDNLKKYDELLAVSGVYWIGFNDAVTLLDGNETRGVTVYGVHQDYFQIEKMDLLHGRYIVSQDVDNRTQSIVIDEDFAIQVFGRADVVGEKLPIETYFGTDQMTIVGVLASTSTTQMLAMYGYQATTYMPITFVQNWIWQDTTVDQIVMKAADQNDVTRIGENVIRLVEIQHENSNKYRISTISDYLDQATTVIDLFTLFMGIVAGISLLVGGIGVMNIMLVSVTERTREIGIRKSLGATNGNINFQFLIESIILTAIGGAIGILFGYLGGLGIGALASMFMGEEIIPFISYRTILLVVAISAGIGIIFGVYPAGKASKLDPIEALRFE